MMGWIHSLMLHLSSVLLYCNLFEQIRMFHITGMFVTQNDNDAFEILSKFLPALILLQVFTWVTTSSY